MGEKVTNSTEKLPIDCIDEALDKEEGLPISSELFTLIFLAPE